MKNSLFYLVLCLFLLVSATKAEVYTSLDGHKFEVNLILQKDSIMLGEPIFMDFEVKNLSDVDLGILYGGDYRNEFSRPDSFDIKVFDASGAIVPKPETFTMGGMSGFQKSPVGQSHRLKLYLPHWATFDKTGNYKIRLVKSLIVRKYGLSITIDDLRAKGVLISLSAPIKVVASDYRKMGAVIDTIGKQVVARDDTAERLVPFINDKRIIKYLAEAIKNNEWLMRHLSKFNDDGALNAIFSRIKDEKPQVRRLVSISLSRSVHPKAFQYLRQMRNDTFYAIRMDIVHHLSKTKTRETTRMLKEMANDENEQVAGEAKRYLQERGEK